MSEHELTLQSMPAVSARTVEEAGRLVGFRPWMWQCGSVRRGSK